LAIELLIKAALLHQQGSFPAEHNLQKLLTEASAAGLSFQLDANAQALLASIAPFEESRYPNPRSPVEIGTEDLRKIQDLWDTLLDQVPEDLRRAFLGADQTIKGGRKLLVKESGTDGAV